MIKILILNACINLGVDVPKDYILTVKDANTLQRAAATCQKSYGDCMKTAELKFVKGGKHFNIVCAPDPRRSYDLLDLNDQDGRF